MLKLRYIKYSLIPKAISLALVIAVFAIQIPANVVFALSLPLTTRNDQMLPGQINVVVLPAEGGQVPVLKWQNSSGLWKRDLGKNALASDFNTENSTYLINTHAASIDESSGESVQDGGASQNVLSEEIQNTTPDTQNVASSSVEQEETEAASEEVGAEDYATSSESLIIPEDVPSEDLDQNQEDIPGIPEEVLEESGEVQSEIPEEQTLEENVSQDVPAQEDLGEVAPTINDNEPEDQASTPLDSVVEEVVSFLEKIIPVAHAQDVLIEDAQSLGSNDILSSEYIEFSGFSYGKDSKNSTSTISGAELKISMYTAPVEGAIILVEYSKDNKTWEALKEIKADGKKGSSSGYVTIKLPSGLIRSIEDTKFRVSYKTQEILDSREGFIFIDSLWIETVNSLIGLNIPLGDFTQEKDPDPNQEEFSSLEIGTRNAKVVVPGSLDKPFLFGEEVNLKKQLNIHPVGANAEVVVQREGGLLIYENAYADTNLKYETTGQGLKEYIELVGKDHPAYFEYSANLSDFDVVQVSETELDLYRKGKGENPLFKLYTIKAPVMYDSEGNTSSEIVLSTENDLIRVTPNSGWLSSAVYPVVVDPTVEISVLNIHSHPVAGDIWGIDFTTSGIADLSISPADEDTLNDVEFVTLYCDNEILEPSVSNNSISFSDWSCDGIGRVEYEVTRTGNHHLLFQFGDATADAFNAALVWKGTTNSLWSEGSNWSTGSKPTSADSVTFDNTCSNCDVIIDENTTVTSFTIAATYTGTITQNDNLSLRMTGAFSQSAGTFKGGTGTTTMGGAITVSGGTWTPATSTVLNSGSVSIDVNSTQEFYHLHSTSTGTRTISTGDTLVVRGDLYLVDGAFNTGTIDARGNIYQSSTFDGGTAAVDFGNNSLAQTWVANGGIGPLVRFDNAADASDSVVINAATTFYGASTTASFSGIIPFSNSSAYDLTFGVAASPEAWEQAAGTFNGGVGTTTFAQSDFVISGGTFNAASTTVFSGNSALINVVSSLSFHNLVLNAGAFQTKTISSGDTLVVNGTLYLTRGNVATGNIQAKGNIVQASTMEGSTAVIDFDNDSLAQTWTVNGGTGPYLRLDSAADASDSIVINAQGGFYGATITPAFVGTIPFSNPSNYEVTFGIGGYLQAAGTFQGWSGTTTMAHAFTISGGTYNASTNTNFTGLSSNIDFSSPQEFYNVSFNTNNAAGKSIGSGDTMIVLNELTLREGSLNGPGVIEARGNVTVSSTFDGGSGALWFTGSSTSGSATQYFSVATSNLFDGDVNVNKSEGQVVLLSDLLMNTTNQDIIITTGTLDINGYNLAVTGTSGTLVVQNGGNLQLQGGETITTNSGYPLFQSGSTATYDGTGSYNIKDYRYQNLTLSGSGSFTAPAGTTTILGNFSNSGGGFVHNSGVVELAGADQTISGNTTFNNLYRATSTASTLTFGAGQTQTVVGTLTLRGSLGNVLTLRSSLADSQWNINPQSTRSVAYLDVQDSNNTNATAINAAGTNSVSSGNNTNWDFGETFTQENYRWYENVDSLSLTTPLSGQNSSLTLSSVSDPLRLRMNLLVGGNDLATSSYNFKLQVSNLTSGGWEDVGATTTVSFYNNPSLTSQSTLSSLLLATSNATGTYEEVNPSADNPFFVASGDLFEFDFSLDVSSIVSGVSYFFRLVFSGGGVLDSYSNYAEVLYNANANPDAPASLGPANLTNGSWTTDNTPTLTFNLSDSDGGDTVRYHILIDDSSDFSSPVANSTSALAAQGAFDYTPSALPDGSYYWRVSASDNGGAASATTTANSGSVAFRIDTTDPTAGTLTVSSVDSSSVTISIAGASDAGSGLVAAPYTFTNSTTGATSGATSSTSWTFSSLSPSTSYSFYAIISDTAGNSVNAATVSTTTLASSSSDSGSSSSGSSGSSGSSSGSQAGLPITGRDLGVVLTASQDGSNFYSSVLKISSNTPVYLAASVSGDMPGGRITYNFDCENDSDFGGAYEYTVQDTSLARVVTEPICSYSTPGYHFAKVEILSNGSPIYDRVLMYIDRGGIVTPTAPTSSLPPSTTTLPTENPTTPTETPETQTPPPQNPSSGEIVENTSSSTETQSSGGISEVISEIVESTVEGVGSGVAQISETVSNISNDVVRVVSNVFSNISSLPGKMMYFTRYTINPVQKLVEYIPEEEIKVGLTTVVMAPATLALQYSISSSGILVNISSLRDLWAALMGFAHGFFTFIGLRKRRRYWGTVYDALNKQGIDPAIVELINLNTGEVVEKSVTDLFGRFGFLDRPGRYKIRASKTHYKFPSDLVTGYKDGAFENVYHGEEFQIVNVEDVIAPNIPMDPMAKDWNQEEKARTGAGKLNVRFEYVVTSLLKILFWTGFSVMFVLLVVKPSLVNAIFMGIYLLLAWLNKYIPDPRLSGRVVSQKVTTENLLLELKYEAMPTVVVAKTVTDKNGRFFLKCAPGEYVLFIKSIGDDENLLLKEMKVKVGNEMILNSTIEI